MTLATLTQSSGYSFMSKVLLRLKINTLHITFNLVLVFEAVSRDRKVDGSNLA